MDSDSQKMTQVGGATLGAAGLIALIWSFHTQIVAVVIIIVGVIAVIAAVLAVAKLGVLRTRGAAKAFKDDLGSKLRATPGGVADADARAKLDDLRRSLQSGMEKLQATGKSLYVLPWYLMVGEPGSGKTKAIGAAGVALPGFQDPMQGAGGTVNMNWWFTNSGIILDTAGRLMLPEVNTGNNPEWDEFLKTLNARRPNCPINGLILAIPADTLITDTATEIDRKAGDIAYQFNKLQVTLGIRFPVFVLITKCDKILGFREFFESVNQPDEQAQLLGWSNPEKLDDAFKPELVEEHLNKVHEQLVRRRARLIQDPVHTDDPNARRTDQIDALYEFPEALVALAPRLRRYLEPIFVAGPLSARPLFLRGIYFTSSLQTGEAVDAAMSAIMGIDIAKSHAGGVVSEKPYFLKHVFQEKVFKEKGLVTRTTNVSQLKRRRKVAVLCAGIVSALALIGFTWLSTYQLKQNVDKHVGVWKLAANWGAADQMEMVGYQDGRYHGESTGSGQTPLVKLHDDARNDVSSEVHVPVVFKPVAYLNPEKLDVERKKAYTALFEGKVLYPLIKRDRENLQRPTESRTWNDDATNALRAMINLEAKRALTAEKPFTLDDVVPYALTDDAKLRADDLKLWRDDRAKWEKDFQWVYSPEGAGATWPPAWAADPDANRTAITKGVDAYIEHAGALAQKNQGTREAVQLVADKLEALNNAELELLKTGDEITTAGGDQWDKAKLPTAHWKERAATVQSAKDDVTTSLTTLLTSAKDWDQATTSLDVYYKKIVDDAIAGQQKEIQSLRDAIPSGTADKTLEAARDKLTRAMEDAGKAKTPQYEAYAAKLSKLAKIMLPLVNGDAKKRLYERQAEIVDLASRQLPGSATDQKSFPDGLDQINSQIKGALDQLDGWRKVATANSRETDLCGLAQNMTQTISGPRRRSTLLEDAVDSAPKTRDEWVAKLADARGTVTVIDIPLTRGIEKDKGFPKPELDPRGMESVSNAWHALMDAGHFAAKGGDRPNVMDWDPLAAKARERQTAFEAVFRDFKTYWATGWLQDFEVPFGTTADWKDRYLPALHRLDRDFDNVDSAIHTVADLKVHGAALAESTASNTPAPNPDALLVKNVRDRLGNWLKLPEDPAQARATLIAMSPARLVERFLLVPNANAQVPPSLYEQYWSAVFAASLDSLARSAELQSRSAADLLWKQYHHFPLAPLDNGPDLSPDDLRRACKAMAEIWGAPQRGGLGAAPAGPAAGGGWTMALPPACDAAVRHLISPAVLPDDPEQRKWLEDLRVVQPWLQSLSDGKVGCRMYIVHGSTVDDSYPYQRVAQTRAALEDPHAPTYDRYGDPVQPKQGIPIQGNSPILVGLLASAETPPGEKGPTILAELDLTSPSGNWPELRLVAESGHGDAKDRTVAQPSAAAAPAGKNVYQVKASCRVRPHKAPVGGAQAQQTLVFEYLVKLDDEFDDTLPIAFWNR